MLINRSWLLLLAACSTTDGEPPTASGLVASPTSVPAGTATTITGSIGFEDPDGDLSALEVAVTLPGGDRTDPARKQLASVAGLKAGVVSWEIVLAPPTPGDYTLELRLVDETEAESNAVTTTITAR